MYKHVQYDLSLCCPAAPAACCMMGVRSWSVWSGEQQLFGGLLCFSRGRHMWVWLAKLFWGHIRMNLSVQKLQLLSYMLYTANAKCGRLVHWKIQHKRTILLVVFSFLILLSVFLIFIKKIQCRIRNLVQRKLFHIKWLAGCFCVTATVFILHRNCTKNYNHRQQPHSLTCSKGNDN